MAGDIEVIGDDGEKFFTYVLDPNPLNNEIIAPEDYLIYVNFRAIPKSRSIISSERTFTNEAAPDSGISFITSTKQGDKRYLTTNYLNNGGYESNIEGFGIKSINIKTQADYASLVDIVFYDARGGGLFNGYEQVDKEGYKFNNSELATFFRLPYPLYELTIKGFYGRTVSQCLHLLKFNFKFDAQNGGFEIHASFVSYADAFMKDILLGRCKAIVNTDAGLSYLNDIQQKKPHVVSLDKFFASLGKLTTVVDDFKAKDSDFKKLQTINTAQAKLTDIQNVIGRHLIAATGTNGQTLPINFGSFSRGSDQLTYRDVLVFRESSNPEFILLRNEYKKASTDFNAYNQSNVSKLGGLNIVALPVDLDTNTTPLAIGNQLVVTVNSLIQKNENSINSAQPTEENFKSDFVYINEKYYVSNLFEIRKSIQKNLNDIEDFKKKYETIVNDNLNRQILTQLGINLTMQGVLDIISYNIEAYLKVIYEIAYAADNPTLQPERLKLLSNIGTDTADDRVYPFPECYDVRNNERLWLGDIVGEDNPAFPEIQLVLACLNNQISLAKIINDNYNKRDNKITTYEQFVTPVVNEKKQNYLPLTIDDFGKNGLENYKPLLLNNGFEPRFAEILADRAYTVYKKGGLRSDGFTDGEFFALQTDSRLYPLYRQILDFERTNESTIQTMISSDLLFEQVSSNGGTPALTIDDNGVFLPNSNDYKVELNSLQEVSIGFKNNPKQRGLVDNNTKSDLICTLFRKQNEGVFNPLIENKIRQFSGNNTISDADIRLFILDGATDKPFGKNTDYNQILAQYKADTICKPFIQAFSAISFGGANKSDSIFEQPYYIAADAQTKAYLFLRTLPYKNKSISDLICNYSAKSEVFLLDFVRLGANIYRETLRRASLNLLNFETIDGLSIQELGLINDEFLKFENSAGEIVPDFDAYSDEVRLTFISYFNDWVNNRFLANDPNIGTELAFKRYVELLDNRIAGVNSAAFQQFSESYAIVEILLKETIVVGTTHAFKLLSNPPTNSITFVREYMTNYLSRFADGFISLSTRKEIEDKKNIQKVTPDKTYNTQKNNPNPAFKSYTKDRDLKIDMYYYLKRIYDQWIAGGSPDGKIFNYCAYSSGGDNAKSLISRFHVIDRTWSYIGDKAVVNPKTLLTLNDNPNMDIKTFIGNMATHSGFNFYSLPSYVNYQNLEAVRDIFKPHVSNKNVSSGATFVLMYAGGYSKVLDIGKNVYFVNDGFDLNKFGRENIPEGFKGRRVPLDYSELDEDEKNKYRMAAFRVAYADQNQSFFKEIDVSQDGAKETAESMYATSEAFDNRGVNKKMYKGTNLYNIMELRSYKCTVKMLGDMMIQPLMYFQLDNIPFFHGAYLITKVSHTITPNTAETTFEGYRMARYVYPLVNESITNFNIPINETLLKDSDRFFKVLPKEDFSITESADEEQLGVEKRKADGTFTFTPYTPSQAVATNCNLGQSIVLFNLPHINNGGRGSDTGRAGGGYNWNSWGNNFKVEDVKCYICATETIAGIFSKLDAEYITNIKSYTTAGSSCARYARLSLENAGVVFNFNRNGNGGANGWTWWAGLPNDGIKYFPYTGKPNYTKSGRNYDNYSDSDYANVIDNGRPDRGTLVDGEYYPTLCTIHGYYLTSDFKERALYDFRGGQQVIPQIINPKLNITQQFYDRDDRMKALKNISPKSKNGVGGSFDMCTLAHIGIYYKGNTVHSFKANPPTIRGMNNSFVPISYFNLTPYIVRAIKNKNPNITTNQIQTTLNNSTSTKKQEFKTNGLDFFGIKLDF